MAIESDINKKKNLVILLTNTGTLPSRIIKIYTRKAYTHVSIGFDLTLSELYSFGRKKLNNPFFGGFVVENCREGLYAKFPDTNCAVYTLEVNPEIYNKARKIINRFLLGKEKYKYNFLGLVGTIINIPISRDSHFFCSQFVATVLEKSGISLFQKPAALVTPYDFMKSDRLKLLYTGKLSRYASEAMGPVNKDVRSNDCYELPSS